MTWFLLVIINCSEPRLPFRQFYEKATLQPFPGQRGELVSNVTDRILHTIADYADYSEAYRDKCK